MKQGTELANKDVAERVDRSGKGDVRVTSIDLRDESGNIIREAVSGHEVVLSLGYKVKDDVVLNDCLLCVNIDNETKGFFNLSSALVDHRKLTMSGEGRLDFRIPKWPLPGGTYHVNIHLESNKVIQDYLEDAASINTIDGDFYGTGKLLHEGWSNSVLVPHSWDQHESN